MAYQPKSYRKFIAGAAAVAVVAPVVAPVASLAATNFTDVEAKYKDAVDFLVSKGINGTTETTFGTQLNIKRVDAAVFVAKALELDTENAPDAGFTDVPDRAKGAVNALKEAGITSGKTTTTFASQQEITRGELAIWLQKAFDLEAGSEELAFTDVADRYEAAVKALVSNEITSGTSATTFGTEASAKRGDFALFIKRAVDATTEVVTEGITSVSAINDTKVEVTFGKAFDKDLITEIEKAGKRFVAYDGSETANSTTVIQSKTITFSADGKKATVIWNGTPKTDVKYTVALMDNNDNTIADTVHEYKNVVLKKGASQPEASANLATDKITIKFDEEMADEAKALANYDVYDANGQKVTGLATIAKDVTNAKWVDVTDKRELEVTLKPAATTKLRAGQTYTLKLTTAGESAVVTDDGDKLSDSNKTIKLKTPSIAEAKPVAKLARVKSVASDATANDGKELSELEIIFDKDLLANATVSPNNIVVKKPGGGELVVKSAKVAADGDKALVLTFDPAEVDGVKESALDFDLTYTIELPENLVDNAYYTNASSKSATVKAESQANVEATSISAKLVRQDNNRAGVDLLVTFDQRVVAAGDLVITHKNKDYVLDDAKFELYHGDTSGKTLIYKNVNEAKASDNAVLPIKENDSYAVEAPVASVKTDLGGKGKANSVELKTSSFTGLSVAAPVVDEVTLKSAEEITVTFKEEIDAANLKASDITVSGYEIRPNGEVSATNISGDGYLDASVSGKTLTLKAKGNFKFKTGFEAGLITIDSEAFIAKSSKISNDEIVVNATNLKVGSAPAVAADLTDKAAPIIVGAQGTATDLEATSGTQDVTLTFSEEVDQVGTAANFASLFTVEGAAKKSHATEATIDDATATIQLTFEAGTFKKSTDVTQVLNVYTKAATAYVVDEAPAKNELQNVKFKGVNKTGTPQ